MVKLSSPKSSGVEGLTAETLPLRPLLPPPPTLSPSIHHSALIGGGRRLQLGQCQTDGTQSDTRPLEVMPWLPPSLPSLLSHHHSQLVGVACSRPAGGTVTHHTPQRWATTSSTSRHETGSDLAVTFGRCSVGRSRETLCLIQIHFVFEVN